MFKKRYWLLLTLLLITVLVIRTFPASWVMYFVQQAVPGFQVSGVSGSLWKGEAQFSQWVNRGHTLPLGQLQWQLRGASLLTLNPCVQFSALAQNQSIKGEGCYSLLSNIVAVKETDVTLPIERISPFFNVNLDGIVDGFVQQLHWGVQGLGETDLTLLWQQAAFYNGNVWVAMGDIQATAEDDQGNLLSKLRSVVDGQKTPPLEVDLQVTVSDLSAAKPRLRVLGTVIPSGQQGLNWQSVLQLIGEPVAGGGYRIDINE